MYVFLNDGFVLQQQAALQVSDLAIQRGYGVFDFFRTANYRPLYIDDYLQRFTHSAQQLGLTIPYSATQIKQLVGELIAKNGQPDAGIKLLLTGGYSEDCYTPQAANFLILQQSIELPTAEKFERGIKIFLHEYQRDLPQVKSINYLTGIYLRNRMLQLGADDVLYHFKQNILEFPRANVFIVTPDQTLATPGEGVLLGITRCKVLELAAAEYTTATSNLSLNDLQQAAEIFLTSTTKRIMPVVQVDGKPVGDGTPGPLTRRLQCRLLAAEQLITG